MSVYQVQQCIFDYLRALEKAPAGERPSISVEGYDLTETERRALIEGDVSAFYTMGTHPVLINGFCRSQGYKRADYRPLFKDAAPTSNRRTRWQKS